MFCGVLFNGNLLVVVVLEVMRGSFYIVDSIVFGLSSFLDIAIDCYEDVVHIKADHILVVNALKL